jgi:putative RNA 2'-phosphotransferase
MDKRRETHISKFLSLVLRHKPETVGIILDANGWADVRGLLVACDAHGEPITMDDLEQVVKNNDKKRFELRYDHAVSTYPVAIRASQGHSVEVDLGYEEAVPPNVLFHGTATRFLPDIQAKGLLKMGRHHVHLSQLEETAWTVGARHGKPFVLSIDAKAMHEAGHQFYKSANGVWLTEIVPSDYIRFASPTTHHRVDHTVIGEWRGGNQVIVGKLKNARGFHLELGGFDKAESDKIIDRLNAELPKIFAEALQ